MMGFPSLDLVGSFMRKNFGPTNEDMRAILKELGPSRTLEPRVGLIDGVWVSACCRTVPFSFVGCSFG
jgi:hypothetical protein